MNQKERVLKALNHEEADRVPIFEAGLGGQIAEYFLARKVKAFGNGTTIKTVLDIQVKGDKEEHKKFIRDNNKDMLELFYKIGFDMIIIVPTGLVTPFDFGLSNFSIADIYDLRILKESENFYRLISEDPGARDFWCTCSYSPDTEILVMMKDNIIEGGEKEFERYIEYLENKNLNIIPEQLKYGLDAFKEAININNEKYNLFLLGYADIQFPAFAPIFRYF